MKRIKGIFLPGLLVFGIILSAFEISVASDFSMGELFLTEEDLSGEWSIIVDKEADQSFVDNWNKERNYKQGWNAKRVHWINVEISDTVIQLIYVEWELETMAKSKINRDVPQDSQCKKGLVCKNVSVEIINTSWLENSDYPCENYVERIYEIILAKCEIMQYEERIIFASWRNGNFEIYVMDADGSKQKNLSNNPHNDWEPSWSPDGKKICFTSNRDGNEEIYAMNADGSSQRKLTNNVATDWEAAWSPDGKRIAFGSNRDGDFDIYIMNANGSKKENLSNNSTYDSVPAWSPTGKKIAFSSYRRGNWEVYVMNDDGSNQTNLTKKDDDDWWPAWSPDGEKIAFTSDRDGNWEIYVMDADGSNQRNLTRNPAQDADPAWSPDGKKIIFISTRNGKDEIFIMNADGSNQKNIYRSPCADRDASWCCQRLIDPCKDISCPDRMCYECNYWAMKCDDGECVRDYIIEVDSKKCGCGNPCEIISCEPECYECDYWAMKCDDGECIKDYVIEWNSERCGCIGDIQKQEEANANFTMAQQHLTDGHYENAITYAQIAKTLYQELNDEEMKIECDQLIADARHEIKNRRHIAIIGAVGVFLTLGIGIALYRLKGRKSIHELEQMMENLDEMLEKGLITKKEYDLAKKEAQEKLKK